MVSDAKAEEESINWAQDFDKALEKVASSNTSLEDRLEKLPAVIREKELELYRLSSEISNVKRTKELISARIMRELSSETVVVEEDKPPRKKYTNESERNAELFKRESKDEPFCEKKAHEEAIHKRYESLKIDLELVKNLFSAAKWLIKLRSLDKSESNEPSR